MTSEEYETALAHAWAVYQATKENKALQATAMLLHAELVEALESEGFGLWRTVTPGGGAQYKVYPTRRTDG